MILPYTLRLLCLCFASFFLIHTALGLAVWTATPGATRLGESMRPRGGARFLLALRLLPVMVAAFAVAGLCVPSYLWLETNEATERVGFICCAMALLGLFLCASTAWRAGRAMALSAWRSRECRRKGQTQREDPLPKTVLNSDAPVLALAGFVRPHVVVSRGVLQTLSSDEWEAALEHERAHHHSRDNLKRLVLLFAPEILPFPFSRFFTRLNRSWAKLIEWAADDEATGADPRRSVSLAGALVQMARMGAGPSVSPLSSSFCGNDQNLPARVDRLLGLAPVSENPRRVRTALGVAAAAIAALTIAAMIRPGTFLSVHHLLEQLIR
jgi:beta-lactamase regulating signal transducer with metallopeptidase domain